MSPRGGSELGEALPGRLKSRSRVVRWSARRLLISMIGKAAISSQRARFRLPPSLWGRVGVGGSYHSLGTWRPRELRGTRSNDNASFPTPHALPPEAYAPWL